MIRLGAPIYGTYDSPDRWAELVKHDGWAAAYCPLADGRDAALVRAYARAAQKAGIVIAEVGVWNNPISRNEAERRKAIAVCQEKLALAEAIGATCCVNIAGSCNPDVWCGPHQENVSRETFDVIVQVTREIIDAVRPTRTFYTLEAMPWVHPDSVDGYAAILRAVDRPAFAVHLDPVNFVTSPRIYFDTAALLADCFRKLGPYIKSCHAKDILLREKPVSVMFDEVRPGLGVLDYAAFLRGLAGLGREVPLMLEHLSSREEYRLAGEYICAKAGEAGVELTTR